MSQQHLTFARRRIFTVELTIAEAGVRKANTNGTPYVVAKGHGKGGRPVTAMSYKGDMMALLLATAVGNTVRLYGSFERGSFSPIGISVPREKAPGADTAADATSETLPARETPPVEAPKVPVEEPAAESKPKRKRASRNKKAAAAAGENTTEIPLAA
jgi:hypothetical protein